MGLSAVSEQVNFFQCFLQLQLIRLLLLLLVSYSSKILSCFFICVGLQNFVLSLKVIEYNICKGCCDFSFNFHRAANQ
jgi:hypothetical protein